MANCKIPLCPREGGKISGVCKPCASSRYYWNKQGPGRVLERRKKLAYYSGRIKYFFSQKGTKK